MYIFTAIEITKKKLESNRERSIQFAKEIIKPKIKNDIKNNVINNNYSSNNDGYDDNNDNFGNDKYINDKDEYGMTNENANKLSELQNKHLNSKRNIEAIRKSMGM